MSNTNKFRFAVLAVLLFTGLLSGCIKEDNTGCPHPFRLFIKAIDADKNDITESGDVQQATLFVFDENGQIINTVSLTADQIKSKKPVDIRNTYLGHKSLKFIVWANLDDKVDYPAVGNVKKHADLYVRLKSKSVTKETTNIAQSPGDLFYGVLDAPVKTGGIETSDDQTIIIGRKTTQLTVTAIHLKQWNANKEGTYTYVLRESPDTYDKDGLLTGNTVKYKPQASMNNKGTFYAPIFRAYPMPTGKPYVVDILFNGKVIYTADKDSDGKAFIPEAGRLLNIIIDFRSQVSIMAVITPWNVVYQNVDY